MTVRARRAWLWVRSYTPGMADGQPLRRSWAQGPLIDRALVAAVLLADVVAQVVARGDSGVQSAPLGGTAVAWAGASAAVLLWRRSRPILTLVACGGAAGVAAGIVPPGLFTQQTGITIILGAYAIGSWSERRTASVVVPLVALVLLVLGARDDGSDLVQAATIGLAAVGLPWMAGRAARSRRRYVEEVERRLATAETERDEQARLAVLDERTHTARELHDVVAHHVSLIGVQAGAARTALDPSPEATRSALLAIEESSRAAVSEMRTLLGALRGGDEGEVLVPQPGVAQLDALVADFRAAGLDVEGTVAAGEDLPPALGPHLLPDRGGGAHQRDPPQRGPDRERQCEGGRYPGAGGRHGPGARPFRYQGGRARPVGPGRTGRALRRSTPRRAHRRRRLRGLRHPPSGIDVTSVVLVDDQPLMRTAFRTILAGAGIEVVGEAGDGDEAVATVARTLPDVVLMDVRMPGRDGIDATIEVTRRFPEARVLVLTTFDEDAHIYGALRAGAAGFLLKNASPEDLVRAVHTVAAGDGVLDPAIIGRVMARVAATAPADVSGVQAIALATLTEREKDVLHLLATGRTNAEVAARLGVGEATAKTHVSRVLTKLGVRDRVQAVIVAHESGFAATPRAFG